MCRSSCEAGRYYQLESIWYEVDGYRPTEVGPGAPWPAEDDVVVFHVYPAGADTAPPYGDLGITGR